MTSGCLDAASAGYIPIYSGDHLFHLVGRLGEDEEDNQADGGSPGGCSDAAIGRAGGRDAGRLHLMAPSPQTLIERPLRTAWLNNGRPGRTTDGTTGERRHIIGTGGCPKDWVLCCSSLTPILLSSRSQHLFPDSARFSRTVLNTNGNCSYI